MINGYDDIDYLINNKNKIEEFERKEMHKNIAVLAGDGIGPEIITEAIKVLQAVTKKYHTLSHTNMP